MRVGTQCQAKCNETGFRLVGPRVRECLSIGRWTGYDQSCVGKPFIESCFAENSFNNELILKSSICYSSWIGDNYNSIIQYTSINIIHKCCTQIFWYVDVEIIEALLIFFVVFDIYMKIIPTMPYESINKVHR